MEANTSGLKLLYLGFAFPPGVHFLFPGINPAGHMLETNLVSELKRSFNLRSAGLLPFEPPTVSSPDPDSGIAHEVLLVEKWPEIWNRALSLAKLKAQYCQWTSQGWESQLVLVYNLSPVYNQFLRWLKRQPRAPKLVLLLLDSPNLGEHLPAFKRFRRRFKPMYTPDSEMLPVFDACIGLSKAVDKYFSPRGVPFLWMPGACLPQRAIREDIGKSDVSGSGPIRFGYYGALGAHAGVQRMVNVFLSQKTEATLEIFGYGKNAEALAEQARCDPRLIFGGLLPPDQCLRFGRRCDVLVNPRPATHGNENNFASKVFDYALSGRAILTSRLSGVEDVLGSDAFYFDAYDFEASLGTAFDQIRRTSRSELHRHGSSVQSKVLSEYSWAAQGRKISSFLRSVVGA